jgi:hypothetical protein
LNTGAINDACRDWQRHTPFNQTLAEFRREFARTQQEQRIISSTASSEGYHAANVAERYGPNYLPADGGFVTAMANLATATSADCEKVATLTKEIATRTDKLKAKVICAKSQEAEIKRMLGAQGNAAPVVPTVQSSAYIRKSYKTKNDSYC